MNKDDEVRRIIRETKQKDAVLIALKERWIMPRDLTKVDIKRAQSAAELDHRIAHLFDEPTE